MSATRFGFCLLLAVLCVSGLSARVGLAQEAEAVGQEAHEAAEDAAEHVVGEHAEEGDVNVLAVDPDLAVWTGIIFLVLFAVLAKFAWGPIAAGLDAREKGIADNIAAAERANEDAQRLLAEYERKLTAAQDEVRAIIEEARRDAEHTQQEIIAKGRAEAQAELDRAKREIEIATDGALTTLARRTADQAVLLAGKIVRQQLSPSDHSQLIDEAVSSFQRKPSAN